VCVCVRVNTQTFTIYKKNVCVCTYMEKLKEFLLDIRQLINNWLIEILIILKSALRILHRYDVYISLNALSPLKMAADSLAISTNFDASTLKMLVGYGKVSILIQMIVLFSVSSKCHVPKQCQNY